MWHEYSGEVTLPTVCLPSPTQVRIVQLIQTLAPCPAVLMQQGIENRMNQQLSDVVLRVTTRGASSCPDAQISSSSCHHRAILLRSADIWQNAFLHAQALDDAVPWPRDESSRDALAIVVLSAAVCESLYGTTDFSLRAQLGRSLQEMLWAQDQWARSSNGL